MSIRWQVDEQRSRALHQELQRIIDFCPQLRIKKLILCGSVGRGEVTATSDLDLIAVQDTTFPFKQRLEDFYNTVLPRLAVDVLIYTPQELTELATKREFIRRLIEEGRIVYEE
ncbi:MAG: nucleotidyltransferase domain-containing protein [Thermacetogeniaceae bacterium]